VNILVTGASGMIGTAVVSSAAASAWSVESLRTHVGTLSADGRPAEALSPGPSVACDITDLDALRPVAEGADVVIHLAAPPSVAASFAAPSEFLRAHVLGTATVVELCRQLAIPRLVYLSSAEVYGRPTRNPVDESAPLAPRSPYAAAKVGAESVIGAAVRAGVLDAVVLRPFSVYGPGARREGVLGLILEQARTGHHIRLRKLDGIRDYCYVDDLAAAVWRAATSGLTGIHTFNVASGTGTRVDELARATLAARYGGLPADASVEALPAGGADGDRPSAADIDELIGDVARARDELGWTATTSLADGLTRTLDWFAATATGG